MCYCDAKHSFFSHCDSSVLLFQSFICFLLQQVIGTQTGSRVGPKGEPGYPGSPGLKGERGPQGKGAESAFSACLQSVGNE